MSASANIFDQIFGFKARKDIQLAKEIAAQTSDPKTKAVVLGNEAIQSTLQRRLPIPSVDASFKQMLLDKSTEDDLLCAASVPSNKNVVIMSIDINYFATGSYKIQWNKSGLGNNEFIDLYSDRATDLHHTPWIACPPSTQLRMVQGKITGGTGYIAGVVSVADYDEVYKWSR
tara:strand:- start:60 stop:578 length:519 start_codon:yes stop_codon:yes gene_type:complete